MLEIRNFLEFALIITIFSLVLFRKMTLFQAYAFFIPFFGIDYDIGVRFTLSQLTLLLLNIVFFIHAVSNTKLLYFKGLNKSVFLFLLYAFVSAFLLSTFVIEFMKTNNPGFLRNEGRYISQIINYSLLYSVFYIAYFNINSVKDIYLTLKYFILGVIITSSIGLVQEFVYAFTKIDITPLGSEEYIRQAATFDYFGVPLIRINSLSGEPKSLGIFATLGIIVIKICNSLNIMLIKKQNVYYVLFFVVLILTLSSSGFILLAILWILSELILRYFYLVPAMSVTKFFSWIIIGILIIVFSEPLGNIINDRIVERDKIEDWDAVIIEALKENPQYLIFGSGLGNIHNIAYNYIDRFENLGFMEDNIFVAKSGYLRLISETGFIGFLLFLFFNTQIIWNSFNNYKRYKFKIFALFASLSVIAIISFLARSYVSEFYLITLATTNALTKKTFFV